MNTNKIQVGIASYGMSGEVFHAPLLFSNPSYMLKGVVERNKLKSTSRYPHINVARSFEELISDKEIELIVVNTPNETHYTYTKLALEAGKHVVVEKPFANNSKEAEDLIEIAKKNKRTLSVFQNRRWDGDYKGVRKVVSGKLLGELIEYEAHYDRYRNFVETHSWKEETGPGSGIVYNLGSHMIDQVVVLFGAPYSVWADIRIQRTGGKVDDFYEIVLNYGHMRVTLKSGYLVREAGPRYIIHGNLGSFLKFGIDPQEQALKDGKLPNVPGWGVESKEWWGILNTEINGVHIEGKVETPPGSYQDFYNNIYEVIRNGAELAVKPEEVLITVKIIEKAYQSIDLKKIIDF